MKEVLPKNWQQFDAKRKNKLIDDLTERLNQISDQNQNYRELLNAKRKQEEVLKHRKNHLHNIAVAILQGDTSGTPKEVYEYAVDLESLLSSDLNDFYKKEESEKVL